MKLEKIYSAADELAPFALSREYIEKYGGYDNSGVILDCGREIVGALFSLDLSLAAADEAEKTGANLIFTHHPAIWDPLKSLEERSAPALFACVKRGISVISAHLNLDAAPGGIDECLMEGLGGSSASVMEPLSSGGYGRAYEVPEVSFAEFAAGIGRTFQTERTVVWGEGPVKRVASFCGGGFDRKALEFARLEGADTLVSSDGKHNLIAEAVERGLKVALLTHYASECYGFERFYRKMREKLRVPCGFFADGRLK